MGAGDGISTEDVSCVRLVWPLHPVPADPSDSRDRVDRITVQNRRGGRSSGNHPGTLTFLQLLVPRAAGAVPDRHIGPGDGIGRAQSASRYVAVARLDSPPRFVLRVVRGAA